MVITLSVPTLHVFEKTSIQLRQTIKRLVVFKEITKDEGEQQLATQLIEQCRAIRENIPDEYKDTDIKEVQ